MKRILKNAYLLDTLHNYEQAAVLIDDRFIEKVGRDIEDVEAEVIDLKGMTLMPAFLDAHVHIKPFKGPYSDRIMRALVFNGVAGVKDLGILDTTSVEEHLAFIKCNAKHGTLRVTSAGRYIDVEGGYGMGPVPGEEWGIKISNPQEAADAVTYLFSAGVNGIKIGISDDAMGMSRGKLTPDEVEAITRRADQLGIWTTAHVYRVDDLRMLVECGIGEAAHTPNDSLMDESLISMMVERDIPMTTTIGKITKDSPLPEHIPPIYASAQEFMDDQLAKKEITLRNLERFYRGGGRINVGTDLMRCEDPMKDATIAVNELMLLRKECNIPMEDVIRAGTVNAARSCRFYDEGVIRTGNSANLIAFDGKLSDDFHELLDLKFVMNQGIIIRE